MRPQNIAFSGLGILHFEGRKRSVDAVMPAYPTHTHTHTHVCRVAQLTQIPIPASACSARSAPPHKLVEEEQWAAMFHSIPSLDSPAVVTQPQLLFS